MPDPSSYPLSDHWDGERFFNPPETAPESYLPPVEPAMGDLTAPRRGKRRSRLAGIIRWRMESRRARWPRLPPDPPPTGDPHAVPPAGAVSVTFIGHSSFLLRLRGLTVLTDPIFSERCSPLSWIGPRRARPPGRALADLPKVDLVLLSHNHYDHMDLPSLAAIGKRDHPRVATPLGNGRHLAGMGFAALHEADWWQEILLPGGVRVSITPARHFSSRTLWDRGRALWGGFMLEVGGKRILYAGDSGHGTHWRQIGQRLGPPDLALLPIGAYGPRSIMAPVHINPREAVAAHQALGARRSIGMHFGTFQLTDEPIDAPRIALDEARQAAGLECGAFLTLGFGETRLFAL